MDGPLLKNIDGPSEIVKTHCVGPGKLSCNDQLPLFCTIFFLKAQLHVQFSEHGKGQLILKCPFGVSKSTKKENENLPSSIGSVKYYFYLLFIHFRLTHRSYFS